MNVLYTERLKDEGRNWLSAKFYTVTTEKKFATGTARTFYIW